MKWVQRTPVSETRLVLPDGATYLNQSWLRRILVKKYKDSNITNFNVKEPKVELEL